jgi:hypothetical protein
MNGKDAPPAWIKALLDVGRVHKCKVAWVLSDRNNVAAMALYASVGGAEGADDAGPADAMLGYSFALADENNGI